MRLIVRVIPRSRANTLEWEGEMLKARLTAPPVEGAANEALIMLLSERLGLPRRACTIVQGAKGRQKVVEISGLTADEVQQRLRGNK